MTTTILVRLIGHCSQAFASRNRMTYTETTIKEPETITRVILGVAKMIE